jgi:hypothetical protein
VGNERAARRGELHCSAELTEKENCIQLAWSSFKTGFTRVQVLFAARNRMWFFAWRAHFSFWGREKSKLIIVGHLVGDVEHIRVVKLVLMKSSRLCVYDSIATFHPIHLPLTWNKRKRKKGKKFNKIVCEQRAQQCRRIVRVSHPDNCRSCFFVDKNEGTKRERAADSTVQGRVETFSATKKKCWPNADSSNFLLNAISECFPSTCTLVLEGGKKLVEEEEKKEFPKCINRLHVEVPFSLSNNESRVESRGLTS